MKLRISKEYLKRESENSERSVDWVTSKGESVIQWIKNYCKRNKIDLHEIEVPDGKWYGKTYTKFELTFKSEHQLNCFQRIGNSHFPYFEFL